MATPVGTGMGSLTTPASSSLFIDLGAIASGLTTQVSLQTKQADEEAAIKQRGLDRADAANRQIIQVNAQSADSAAQNREQQLSVLSGVATQIDKAKVAMALSDSQNPMDRLKLWMLQQTDPAYTRAGNLERIGYLQSAAQALGGIDAIKQTGYTAQMDQIKNQLTEDNMLDEKTRSLLQIQVEQGQRKIDAMTTANNTLADQMKQNEAIKASTIDNMTDEQIQAAQQDAQTSGKTTVNGVELGNEQLIQAVRTRRQQTFNDYVYKIQMQDNTVNQLTMEQTDQAIAQARQSKDGTVEMNGVSVGLASLQARKSTLMNMDTTMLQNEGQQMALKKAMLDQTNQDYVDSLSVGQLNDAIMHGGVIATTGRKLDMTQLKQALDLKTQANATDLQNRVATAQMKSPYYSAVETQNYYKSIKAPAGSQLANAIATQQQVIAASANLADSTSPQDQMAYMDIVDGSRKAVESAIDAQAQLMSRGDKDKAAALSMTLRGQPIPPEIIQSALETRLPAGKPLTDWLSPEDATLVRTQYQAVMQNLRMTDPTATDKDRQPEAVAAAMKLLRDKQLATVSDQLRAFETQTPSSPIYGYFKGMPGKFMSLIRQSDAQGDQTYQKATGKNDKDMADIRSGAVQDPNYAAAQFAALYTNLEKLQTGLGDQYVDWWHSDARGQMVNQYAAAQAQVSSSFQDNVTNSIVAPGLSDLLSGVPQIMEDGRMWATAGAVDREHKLFLQFGNAPESKQLFLLQNDASLNDTDRKQIFASILQPLIQEVTTRKMGAEDGTSYIEHQLRAMKPEDPATKSLLQKLLKNRDAGIASLENWAKAQTNPFTQTNGYLTPGYDQTEENAITRPANQVGAYALNLLPNMINAIRGADPAKQYTDSYPWYVDLLKSQGVIK